MIVVALQRSSKDPLLSLYSYNRSHMLNLYNMEYPCGVPQGDPILWHHLSGFITNIILPLDNLMSAILVIHAQCVITWSYLTNRNRAKITEHQAAPALVGYWQCANSWQQGRFADPPHWVFCFLLHPPRHPPLMICIL